MTLVRALFVVFAILMVPAVSFAIPVPGTPTADVVVTGLNGPIRLSAIVTPTTDVTFTAILDTALLPVPPTLFVIDAEILFNTDPFVQYSLGVTNLALVPTTFTFFLATPFGGGPYSTLLSSHASNVTDGGPTPNGSVEVTPSGGALIHRPQINGVETAVGQFGDGCTPSGSPSFSAFCDVGSGSFAIPAVSGPGTLGVTVAFTLSPGDSYAATGRVEIFDGRGTTGVPEPSAFILGVGVLAGLVYYRRRR